MLHLWCATRFLDPYIYQMSQTRTRANRQQSHHTDYNSAAIWRNSVYNVSRGWRNSSINCHMPPDEIPTSSYTE